uniref:Uncharacterized protein n=1 Tax=Avena sativa TaxID=4498 RepID=A0ACD5T921_AVESA
MQRGPRNLGCFNDDEEKVAYRKYILKKTYDGSEENCYDKLRLPKRNFHDLCAMLREKCGLKDSIYVTVEENVDMFLQVVGHGIKMRVLGGTYQRSIETISRHLSTVLSAILPLTNEFIKLPDPSVNPPIDYKWKWFGNALGALDGCHIPVHVNVADKGRSTRYHLKEWVASQQQPQNEKELFNLRHARARNVVERTFGLLKKKWAMLRSCSFFPIEDQIRLINACCVLHNYARDRQHVRDNLLLQEVDDELAAMAPEPIDDTTLIRSVQQTTAWSNFRQQFADEISMAEPKGKKGTRNCLTWTPEMDTALLVVLVEHHNNGDHAQNGWKPHVYSACIRNVKEKCEVDISKENIVGRIKTFDKHYEIISKMLAQSGFG